MKKGLLILLMLSFHSSYAQKRVKKVPLKNEVLPTSSRSSKGKVVYSHIKPFDIYWTQANLMFGKVVSVRLTFDGKVWGATRYKEDLINHTKDSVSLAPVVSFESVFRRLKANRIFTLPDQDSLQLEGAVDDGNDYTIKVTANKKHRSYSYSNPEIYKHSNPSVGVLDNYVAINNVMEKGFKEKSRSNSSEK